jgi:large subunit ribosomal protein L18
MKMATVRFRRKREGRTDYKRRLRLLLSKKPRAVVRKSAKSITVQISSFDVKGDNTLVMVNSKSLSKLGWKHGFKNMPAAYLAGLYAGVQAKKKKVTEVVVDFGLQKVLYGGKLFAAVKGLVDAGINTNTPEKVFPSEERISGAHIAEYAKTVKFSGYEKAGTDPTKMVEVFKKVKENILHG